MLKVLYTALCLTALSSQLAEACTADDIAAYNYVSGVSTWVCTPSGSGPAVSCVVNDFVLDFDLDAASGNYIAVMDLQRPNVPITQIELPLDPTNCFFIEGTRTAENQGPAQSAANAFSLGIPVSAGIVNDTGAPFGRWVSSGLIGALESCEDLDWLNIDLDGIRQGAPPRNIACDLEGSGHSLIAASVLPEGVMGSIVANETRFVALELSSGEPLLIEVQLYNATEGWIVAYPVGVLRVDETQSVTLRVSDLGFSAVASATSQNTNLDLNIRDANALWLGLLGQNEYALPEIGITFGSGGAALPCGSGGECPRISCRTAPISDAWTRSLALDADQRELVCRLLSEYSGAPHPDGQPRAEDIRRLLIRSLQETVSEGSWDILPFAVPGVRGHVEYTLSGYNAIVGYVPPMLISTSIREVEVISCNQPSPQSASCRIRVGTEGATRAAMPESVQREFLEGMLSGQSDRVITVDFVRNGDRWQLVAPADVWSALFGQ